MNQSQVPTPYSSAPDTSDDYAHIPASNLQFPWKLHVVLAKLEVTGQDDVMSWVPGSSTAFQIHDRKRFMAEVMPRFFSSNKFKSFQRNLNLWGFKAETKEPLRGAFSHPHFVRNRPDLCHSMKRSCNGTASAVPKTLGKAKAMKKAKAEAAASSPASLSKPRRCVSFAASVAMNRKAAPPPPPPAAPSAPINLGALSSSQQQEALMLLAAISSDPQLIPTQWQAQLESANTAAAAGVRTSPPVSSCSLPEQQQPQQQPRQEQQQQQPSASDVTAALQQVLVHLNQLQQHQQMLRQRSMECRAQEAVTNMILQHLISQGQPQTNPSLFAAENHPYLAGLGAVMTISTSLANPHKGMGLANQKTAANLLNTILQELHRRGN